MLHALLMFEMKRFYGKPREFSQSDGQKNPQIAKQNQNVVYQCLKSRIEEKYHNLMTHTA